MVYRSNFNFCAVTNFTKAKGKTNVCLYGCLLMEISFYLNCILMIFFIFVLSQTSQMQKRNLGQLNISGICFSGLKREVSYIIIFKPNDRYISIASIKLFQ